MIEAAPAEQEQPIVFFVHVMKTGGSTALQSVRGTYPEGTRYPDTSVDFMVEAKSSPQLLMNLSPQRRSELRWISPHVPLSTALQFKRQVQRPVSITLVLRDGFDRAVSHLRQVARAFDYAYGYEQLIDMPLVGEFFFSNHQTRALSAPAESWEEWNHCFQALTLMHHYKRAPEATVTVAPMTQADLQNAIAGLGEIDILGLQDQYSQWWQRCSETYGWPAAPVEPVNVSVGQERSDVPSIPDAVLAELRVRNRLDTRLYDAAKNILGY